ncbi:NUDIX domain-containing protein [Arachnia propionica]|uniref:NUDIX hydrolase n=1 Tax=Arachnia propionica TaxID=1750 RepID=UPI0030D584D5
MSKKPKIVSAGGVVLREHTNGLQVLLIHRERYDDWSLPKGKGEADELLPETAIREIQEETGVTARLGLRLPSLRYKVGKRPKAVHYWRSSVLSQRPRRPDQEVSAVKWFPIDAALKKATYPDERAVIEAAVAAPPTNALLIVRHAKAMQRKHWSGDDRKRRLSGRGRDQANRLVDVLAAFGIERLVSSASARCKETLKPYAKTQKISIETYDQLTEESAAKNPKAVHKLMAELLKNLDRPTAVCGHRPVLPEMYAGLAVKEKPMVVSEVRALHFGPDGLVTMETFKPTA